MRNKLICLLLVAAMSLLVVVPAFAQDQTDTPFVACGDLSEADCAILKEAALAMQELSSYAFDVSFNVNVNDLPDMQVNPIDLTFTMAGNWSAKEPAQSAMATMRSLYTSDPSAEGNKALAEQFPKLILDLYRGINIDATIGLHLPQAIADSISKDSDVPMPSELNFGVRLVDGMLYMDLAQIKALAGKEYPFTADWVGFDLAGLLEISMDEAQSQRNSRSDSFTNGLAAGAATAQLVKAVQEFVTVERLDNTKLDDGQDGAVFQSTYDVVRFLTSDAFTAMVKQMAQASTAVDSATVDELEKNMTMFAFLAPMVFRDLSVTSTTTIGLKDRYTYAADMTLNWDLAGLLQLAAMSDQSMRSSLPADAKPAIDIAVGATYGKFNEELSIEAPADVQVIPLDQLAPPDTSTLL